MALITTVRSDTRCNCEHGLCRHTQKGEMCVRPAGDNRFDYIGQVCDPCAALYLVEGVEPLARVARLAGLES